ncbi:hypothetical protein SLS58_001311 [Diplodia intermedia]|uniref:Zn(2)-C6 fungal-type domain-containing protein n=1 Tax=Diplodia intermedia TaxID=856260 RepID=A0ABR3U2T4_9PEZI
MSVFSPHAGGSLSPPDPSDGSLRRDRASIAAQACETCRARKSKCDERRPRCGLCQRVGAECRYREPLPTKKDKTMVYMLDALQRIEAKVDHIGRSIEPESARWLANQTPTAKVSSSHKVLLWPFIHARLAELDVDVAKDLQALTQEGTPWFLNHELRKHPQPLPCDARLEAEPISNISAPDAARRVRFPRLTYEEMRTYTAHYFKTFNVLYLILDRRHFTDIMLPKVVKHGFGDSDYESIICLLVFALGKVALDGTWSAPVDNGMPFESGVRGGTHDRPPGLDIFNEARRRYGFVANECSLESIQITLLFATEEDQQTVMYFLAMIALRQLVTRVHETIFEASKATSEIPEGQDGPPTHVIRELSRQLESWRSMLPPPLQWTDEPPEARFQYIHPDSPETVRSFAPGSTSIPSESPNALDLATAHLRSRYYYARFILYRPFVFKVLHWPAQTTDEDRQFAGMCIKSIMLWPIALAPPKNRKRLVPYLFVWTQNFISILLVLRATTVSAILTDICRKTIDNTELMLTVESLLEWLADVRTIDGVALWSWKILDPLFRDVFPHSAVANS